MTIDKWVALICEETEALEQCRIAREQIEDPSLLATVQDCDESHRQRLDQLQAKSRAEREKLHGIEFSASEKSCLKEPRPETDDDEQAVFRYLIKLESERLETYKSILNSTDGEVSDVISTLLIPQQERIANALINFSKLMQL